MNELNKLIQQQAEEIRIMCYWYRKIKSSCNWKSDKDYWCSLRGLIILYEVPEDQIQYFIQALHLLKLGEITAKRKNTMYQKYAGTFYLLPLFKNQYHEKIKAIRASIGIVQQFCEVCGVELINNIRYRYCDSCREAKRQEQKKAWYNNNKERMKAKSKKYYQENKEKIKEYNKKYYQNKTKGEKKNEEKNQKTM